jgi:hypothetical protein
MFEYEDLVYMAGIFDGEGSVSIDVQSPNKTRKYYYYSLRIVLINTNLILMEWLVKTFGGSYRARKKIEGRKTCYCWSKFSRQAAEILEQCLPYMKVKRDHVLIFLEFMNTMGKTGWNVSEETRNHRQLLYEKMRKLNQFGIQ